MRVLAIVPAYNEQDSIRDLVAGIKTHLPAADILVINDGSTDDTARIAAGIPEIDYLDLPFNMGVGAAVLAGMQYCLRRGYDILIRLDGDGQHPPAEAAALIDAVASGADMAVGSRYLAENSVYSSVTRMMGIKFLEGLSRVMLGRRFTDNTSGFRAFSRRAMEFLVRDYPYDFPEPEEIYMLEKGGFKIVEVPVIMRQRTSGVTSINFVRTWYFLAKVLLTIFVKYTLGGRR